MYNKIEIEVKYRNKTYKFKGGFQAYIFHTGVYNDIDTKFSVKALLKFVSLVEDCYLSDDNRTPLGDLADYVAQNWKKLKQLHPYKIMDKFYDQHF